MTKEKGQLADRVVLLEGCIQALTGWGKISIKRRCVRDRKGETVGSRQSQESTILYKKRKK